jgi:hypothetical protein
MKNDIEITISEMRINGITAVRIMKCLKKHEPEIWEAFRQILKQKLPIHSVSGSVCDHPNAYDVKTYLMYCPDCEIYYEE